MRGVQRTPTSSIRPKPCRDARQKWRRRRFDVVNGRKRRRGMSRRSTGCGDLQWADEPRGGGDMAGPAISSCSTGRWSTPLQFPRAQPVLPRHEPGSTPGRRCRVRRAGEREISSTKRSLGGLIRYSLGNLLAFSSLPLVAVAHVGFATGVSARCCPSRRFTATSPAPRRSVSPP